MGGDFNAMLGEPCEGDDTDILGTCGFGQRNERGWMLAHWVARTGLVVQSRLDPLVSVEDSWTCRRAMDGQLVQIDYIFSTGDLALVMGKYDHSMPVGLDHRCVHCILQSCVGKRQKWKKRISFKNWRPQLNCDDTPTQYQNHIRQHLQTTTRASADTLEQILIQAAHKHGRSNHQTICFHPSMRLKHLRALRKQTTDPRLRKMWSLQIRNVHRREVRAWKTSQLQMFLGTASRWRDLRKFLPRPTRQHIVVQPHEDGFASMLEALFAGPIQHLEKPNVLTEPLWSLAELGRAVLRLKLRKCGDDVGLTAEVLKHVPAEFWEHLLSVYNDILCHGTVPRSWCCTLFKMLPKKVRPTQATDFRPIANIRGREGRVGNDMLHVNSMAELGSDSREVQCLDNGDMTSTFIVFAKNARLQNRLPEMLGELAGLCWDIVLFSETRSALGTVRFDSGHLFLGSTPLSPAAGVGILLHERHVSKLKLVKQISLRLMFADVVLSHGTVRFVAAYAPHSGYSRDVLNKFYEDLHACLEDARGKRFQLVVGGDFNTQLNTGLRGTLLQDVVEPLTSLLPTMMTIISATWTPGHSKVLAASADALISSCVARRCVLLQHMPHAIWTLAQTIVQ